MARSKQHRVLPTCSALLAALLLSACATSTVPLPGRAVPIDPSITHKRMASLIVNGGRQPAWDQPDRDLTARIQLEPTPGAMQKRARERIYRGEVLTSGPYSDHYVAIIQTIPITRFFRVLRKVQCDTRMWVTLVSPSMVRSNPMYVSGISRNEEPAYGCEKHFHERFRAGNDPELAGADGVLVDSETVKNFGDHGPFVNQMHFGMQGYAIQFGEPTDAEIRALLARMPVSPIEIRQVRALAYWLEKRQAINRYRELMKLATPRPDGLGIFYDWNLGAIALLRALAADPNPVDRPFLLSILAASADVSADGRDPEMPRVVRSSRNDYAIVAAHALACLGPDPDTIRELVRIAHFGVRNPHKTAAVQVLATWGETRRLDLKAHPALTRIDFLTDRALRGEMNFSCPYRISYV